LLNLKIMQELSALLCMLTKRLANNGTLYSI
jgi:hypothetical protein